jgi:hypothetical protein
MTFSEWLKVIFGAIGVFLIPFIKQFLTSVGVILANAAMEAVTAAETSGLNGAEKRAAAFKAIVEKLKAQGITLAAKTVNSAIEAALAKLTAEKKEAV